MKEKKIIYVDMDGVLVNYKHHNEGQEHKKGDFLEMEPVIDAISSFNYLANNPNYDVYILSTAPWNNTSSLEEKRLWVEKFIGKNAYKRLILSHNKNLNIGDYLIDDRTANGAGEFKGELIHFGQASQRNWNEVIKYICIKEEIKFPEYVFSNNK